MYKRRIIDQRIEELLNAPVAIQLKGSKWCGKTTTGKHFSKSFIDLQSPTQGANYKLIAENNIALLLEGEKPRLIDEWQEVKTIWNAVRREVDDSPSKKVEYFLTGSVVPTDTEGLHTGLGRIVGLEMKPMSLFESGESNGSVSLSSLLKSDVMVQSHSSLTYSDLAYLTCRGGWPKIIDLSPEQALLIAQSYVTEFCERDVSRYDGVKRDPLLAKAILKAYSRQISTIDSDTSLFKDVQSIFGDVSQTTLKQYLHVFQSLFVIDEISSWNPNIRSKTAISSSPKKSFVDPSIAAAALQCTPKDLELDPETFGLLFENLVDRDLSVYLANRGGHLQHYRDRYGVECDSIVCFPSGEYGLVQAKLGGKKVEEAIDTMLKIASLIEKNKAEHPEDKTLRMPSFMLVVTGTEYAYKVTNKGKGSIYVVPLGCLKD